MLTLKRMMEMKNSNEKIAMITAYDYPSAKLAEQAGADMILVGDSLGMVVLGYDSTVPVTVADMVHHGKAVQRGATDTYLVVDMPFMSYHVSMEETMRNAAEIFQSTGAQALKLEGGGEVLKSIRRLKVAGIPVIGHLGLTPQTVNVLGGYKVQGKNQETAKQLIEDAVAIEESGAIALVLECVPKELAELVSEKLSIPTIGIGAGPFCDGQVLVYHDILRYGVNRLPKFVKSYLDGNESFSAGLSGYVQDVKSGIFPEEKHSFTMDKGLLPKKEGDKT
ncbi:3-methyl-2-oxobutanoate hydroxymethyltransferase [Thalassobacillus pellis]|uniref:3-methyl-2-oxobutanoate hydroxymethyltransferase n=1 Tax=Thalassobacillus pellis TaxID=748008 RepID=UPI00196207D1|nr:3-methyl-2-oxobutanoate hydroxymethyltransferase [Thalassobacillus pellis]MBM7552489.1 3-methyl-2-oxobutanoate hydroxymethyltransferase [Thalassobacillus pellis]